MKMKYNKLRANVVFLTILFIFNLREIASGYTETCNPLQSKREHLNIRLKEHLIYETTTDHHNCARFCFYLAACKSFDYDRLTNACKLNDADSTDVLATEFETRVHSIYSDISEWPQGIAGTCGSRPCSPNQRCLPSYPPRCINIDISTVQCLVEGKWEEKTCVPKDCGQPTTENGIATLLDSSNTIYMALATVTCNEGYETNISHVRCQSDGTWSAGNCSKTNCGQPTTENGIATLLDSSNTTYMALATVTCNEGYETNISHVKCQSDGTWSAGNCSKINCGQPTTENGFAKLLDSFDTSYMALATVTCNEGYETNISHVNCQSDGTWSAGNCSKISCGALPSIANGTATLSLPGATLYLDTATLECNYGYTATPATFKCLSSKSWEYSHCACLPPDNYTGSLDSTKNGYTCQRWDSQIPHHHTETNDSLYPDTSVSAANNYCRSIGRGYLWCFITYAYQRWDYCNEPTYMC